MDRYAILAQVHFFRGLSDDSRRALADVAIPREVRKRDVLFREGDAGHSLYLLNRGHVRLHRVSPDGTEVVIKVVKPGETFGEVVLFEQSRYPVTATALSDCGIFLFPRRDIRALLRRDEFRDDFLAMLMGKLRYLTGRVLYLTAADVEERLHQFLLEQFGDQKIAMLGISKKEVAAAIGTTPETLSRLILRLQNEGVLRWRGRRIERLKARPAGAGGGRRGGR
jgi:CRP/FNR family transcriptional regulator